MQTTKSINNVLSRLTDERLIHIVENHNDLAGYYDEVLSVIEDPDYIIKVYGDALIALKQLESKFLAVVYKEVNRDDKNCIFYKQNKT